MLLYSQSCSCIKNPDIIIPKPDLDIFDNNCLDTHNQLLINNPNVHLIQKMSYNRLASIIKGEDQELRNPVIFDCRSLKEYNGGHIVGAKNLIKYESLLNFFNTNRDTNRCVIFHCEFSSKRGPGWANVFRSLDRTMNNYPDLSFPKTYILKGGYKDFYEHYPNLCINGYLPMDDCPREDRKEAKKLLKAELEKGIRFRIGTPPTQKRGKAYSLSDIKTSSSQPIDYY